MIASVCVSTIVNKNKWQVITALLVPIVLFLIINDPKTGYFLFVRFLSLPDNEEKLAIVNKIIMMTQMEFVKNIQVMIVNISMKIRNPFYRLIALGLGCEYGFQVFLTIGGTMKFIPMTGITLPLVSYGGSSVMSTIIMIAIVQGLYIMREDEDERVEKARREFEREEEEEDDFEKAIIQAGGIANVGRKSRKW
jgi:hypothetical protein